MKSVIRNHNSGYRFIDKACNEIGQIFEKPYLIEIKPYKPPRTLPQNARFHAMINELAKEIGYSASDLKDWLKLEYGPKKYFVFQGIEKDIPMSTADYNKVQMIDMIGHLERIGAEIGFVFSDQGEQSEN